MHTPKTAILHIVEEARQNGRRVGDVRGSNGRPIIDGRRGQAMDPPPLPLVGGIPYFLKSSTGLMR